MALLLKSEVEHIFLPLDYPHQLLNLSNYLLLLDAGYLEGRFPLTHIRVGSGLLGLGHWPGSAKSFPTLGKFGTEGSFLVFLGLVLELLLFGLEGGLEVEEAMGVIGPCSWIRVGQFLNLLEKMDQIDANLLLVPAHLLHLLAVLLLEGVHGVSLSFEVGLEFLEEGLVLSLLAGGDGGLVGFSLIDLDAFEVELGAVVDLAHVEVDALAEDREDRPVPFPQPLEGQLQLLGLLAKGLLDGVLRKAPATLLQEGACRVLSQVLLPAYYEEQSPLPFLSPGQRTQPQANRTAARFLFQGYRASRQAESLYRERSAPAKSGMKVQDGHLLLGVTVAARVLFS